MGDYDFKSSTIDKGLEIAKDFVDKLIMPSVEETGLFLKDYVTFWRFNNQVKILNKAKNICDNHNINIKKISLKILAPLLEYSSLEEDETLQDKWSILLSNLIDSQQNIENHVFPYILSQLSKDEFLSLEKVCDNCFNRRESFETDYTILKSKSDKEIDDISLEIKELIKQKSAYIERGLGNDYYQFDFKISKLKRESIASITATKILLYEINKAELVEQSLFKNYELSNLIRLGLIKEEKNFYAREQTLEIPLDREDNWAKIINDVAQVDLQVDLHSKIKFILTPLGELFFKACSEKK